MPDYIEAAIALPRPTSAFVWNHTVSGNPFNLGGTQPANLNYASVPTLVDLINGGWVDTLVSNG